MTTTLQPVQFANRISPSKLGEIEACPMFFQEPTERNAAADEGTLMHEAFETGDLSGLHDEEQIKSVQNCLDYVKTLAPNPLPTGGVRGSVTEYDRIFNEIWLESDIGKRGKADKIIFPAGEPDHAHLVDAKMGKVPVAHAKDNAQGIDYAYRVFLKWPEVQRVTVHFVLPRQMDATQHTFHRDPDFLLLRKRIILAHERYNDPFKQPTPNFEKACAYCSLKARCPALSGSVVHVARKLNLLPIPEDFAPDRPRTPEERGLVQNLADLMIKWGEETKRYNTQSVMLGAEAEGFKVQTRAGNVRVADTAAFVATVADLFGVLPNDLVATAGSMSFPDTVDFIWNNVDHDEVLRPLLGLEPDSELTALDVRRFLQNRLGPVIAQGPSTSFLAKERKGKKKELKAAAAAQAEEAVKMRKEIEAMSPSVE